MAEMNHPTSIRNVNLLYLKAFLVTLVGSVVLPAISLGWHAVIKELVLIGLLLIVFLSLTAKNVNVSLGLRGVSWRAAELSLIVGFGLWRFDWFLATTINQTLDYTIPLTPERLNVTLLDRVMMVIGTAILAPNRRCDLPPLTLCRCTSSGRPRQSQY
ncbi:MAG: hypothetical protein ACOC8C_02305 [Chloroflexota bacterium]